jgi:transcriptional regulator with XRE-family HTH domain
MITVNQNIRFLRKRMGLTQEKFATLLGVKRSLIGAYEEGRAVPPAENLAKLAQVFDISLDQLLNHNFIDFPLADIQQASKAIEEAREVDVPKNVFEDLKIEKPSFLENKKTATFQSDLFSAKSEETAINKTAGADTKIRYIAKEVQKQYLSDIDLKKSLEDYPVLSLPFFPKGYLRAFESNTDFPITESIIVGEKVENFDLIKNGENHLIFTKSQGMVYRRVFNQLSVKGTILTSADKASIGSAEFIKSDILELWFVKGYFSKSLPSPQLPLNDIQSKISDLKNQIDDLVNRQATS